MGIVTTVVPRGGAGVFTVGLVLGLALGIIALLFAA